MTHAGVVDWVITDGIVPYPDAVSAMEHRVARIAAGDMPEAIWLLEHSALYTAGTSAKPHDLLSPTRFPVFDAGRGGQYTYHGPGQRVVYTILDVRRRGGDVRGFVAMLEAWVIETLAAFAVRGVVRPGRVGVWVDHPTSGHEAKIAAIGIRIRRGISFHGLSLNVEPDLSHFDGIVPCGIADRGVTSLVDLGLPVTLPDVDVALRAAFERTVAETRTAEAI